MCPTLSIITICRNNKEGLASTARSLSLIKQKNPESVEWIIIDGASEDGTLQYISNNSEIIDYYLSEPDSGIYNAMNKGISHSNGRYLLFLNAGDILTNCIIEAEISSLLQDNYDLYYGNAYIKRNAAFVEKEYPDHLDIDFFFLDSLCHQSVFFKRELLLDLQYDESYRLASDLDIIMRCLFEKHCSYLHLTSPVCYYEGGGFSDLHYYDIARQERRIIISKFLDGKEYWYDAILLRKELNDESLFSALSFLPYRKRLTSACRFMISFLVSFYKRLNH